MTDIILVQWQFEKAACLATSSNRTWTLVSMLHIIITIGSRVFHVDTLDERLSPNFLQSTGSVCLDTSKFAIRYF